MPCRMKELHVMDIGCSSDLPNSGRGGGGGIRDESGPSAGAGGYTALSLSAREQR